MGAIKIVMASAGSGKTHRLGQLVVEAIVSGKARPEAIIATTFTRKAAAELLERAREHLFKANRPDDAERLLAARIGTVNAVCGNLVGDFAFELGLSPNLRVLGEDGREASLLLRKVIAAVVDDATLDAAARLSSRFSEFDWETHVRRMVELARTNGIGPAALAAMAAASRAEILGFVGTGFRIGALLDATLKRAIDAFQAGFSGLGDDTKKTATFMDALHRPLMRLRSNETPQWEDWLRLSTAQPGAKSRTAAEAVQQAAADHDQHPTLHADLADAVALVFGVTSRVMEGWQAEKARHGLLDFADQEGLALNLLSMPETRTRLDGAIDLVLVDEFQDTSPLQLAIVLQLANLAKDSVWVGDPKQAIYGFRGADPQLMERAVDVLLAGKSPETLGKSWRSRPALVALTSAIFERAFGADGMPPERVHLEPSNPVEPPGLGPVVEHWVLDSSNKEGDAESIATGVTLLLSDDMVRVRDRLTGGIRRLRAGDIAVLCLKNEKCVAIANALAGLGVAAVAARPGLFATLEGRVVLASLRLWADTEDRLAAAELLRLLVHPGDGDAFINDLLEDGSGVPGAGSEIISGLRSRATELAWAGPVDALDALVDVVQLRELCLSWGDADRRLANLDAIRALAVAFSGECRAEGRAATPLGLIAEWIALSDDGADKLPVDAGPDTVTVSTWHAAKGLEWPIVVVDPSQAGDARVLGVNAVPRDGAFDPQDPLAGRRIRYLPYPFHPSQSSAPFHQRLAVSPLQLDANRERSRELLRLVYVAMTRARDRIVIATREGAINKGAFEVLRDGGGPLLENPDPLDGPRNVLWAGVSVEVHVRRCGMSTPLAPLRTPGSGPVPSGPKPHPRAYLTPSSLEGAGRAAEVADLGSAFTVTAGAPMDRVGSAVHLFLGSDDPSRPVVARQASAGRCLVQWEVEPHLAAGALVDASDRLRAFVQSRWPGARWHREWPLQLRQADGSVLRGTCDLALETADSIILVDHKSFPGSVADAVATAARHAGQLSAYARMLEAATGKRVAGTWIHLALAGRMVRVEATEPG